MATVTVTKAGALALAVEKASRKTMLPATPEANAAIPKKRKRLAKAFKRPLDKTLRSVQLVRGKYSLPEDEYERMVELKQRLSQQGLTVKKCDLVRAGLILLAALDDADLKDLVSTVTTVD